MTDIEEKNSFNLLRAGFFTRRIEHPLSRFEGYEIVKDAVEAETVGSRRWFVLQSLRAYAAFRSPGAGSEGYEAYSSIFDQISQAPKAKAETIARLAIKDYVFTVNGKLRDLGLQDSETTQQILLKAWGAYVQSLAWPNVQTLKTGSEPAWAEAFRNAEMEKAALPLLEEALKQPGQSYGILKTAVETYAELQPEKAQALLAPLKATLPTGDQREVEWFYQRQVDVLAQLNRWPEAIAAQKEKLKATGRGQARLAELLWKNQNPKEAQDVIATLKKLDSNTSEVLEAARRFVGINQTETAVDLLQTFLKAPRTRSAEAELNARYALAVSLLRLKRNDEAKSVLDIQIPTTALNTNAQAALAAMTQLRHTLQ